MSDNEGPTGGPSSNDDASLPKATVAKLAQECLSEGVSCAKDVKDMLAECCKEFVLLVSAEANEICEKEAKKTILPEHVIGALKSLGYESYVSQLEEVASEQKQQSKDKSARKGANKLAASGMTEEQLIKQQEELFASSRARFEAAAAPESIV